MTHLQSQSVADIATPQAELYLTQLCKHFAHKAPVTYDAHSGEINLPMGVCALRADTGILTLSLSASDASDLARLQDVVARHLLRFAFREDLKVDWRDAPSREAA